MITPSATKLGSTANAETPISVASNFLAMDRHSYLPLGLLFRIDVNHDCGDGHELRLQRYSAFFALRGLWPIDVDQPRATSVVHIDVVQRTISYEKRASASDEGKSAGTVAAD
jgi:hypothetical protein